MDTERKEFLDTEGVTTLWTKTKEKIQNAIDIFNQKVEDIESSVAGVKDINAQSLQENIKTNADNLSTLSNLIGDETTGIIKDIKDLEEKDAEIDSTIEPIAPLKEMCVYFPYRIQSGGDCIIIKIPDSTKPSGYSIVVNDLGVADAAEELAQFLQNYGINHIDKIIISHYHTDHVGGIASWGAHDKFVGSSLVTLYVLKDYIDSSTEFYLPHDAVTLTNTSESDLKGSFAAALSFKSQIISFIEEVNNPNSELPIHYPKIKNDGTKEDTSFTIGDAYFEFFNIDEASLESYKQVNLSSSLKEEPYPNYNNFSMVVQMTYGDKVFLFTGDIEEAAQKTIYDKIKNPNVLKVAHHDFNYRAYDEHLKRLTPECAIVCNYATGDCMPYDVKMRRAFYTALNNIAEIYQTNDGTIVLASDGRTISVKESGGRDNIYGDVNLVSATGFPEDSYLPKGSAYWCDINRVAIPGSYFIQTAAVAQKVRNVPCDDSGFKLIVEYLNPGSIKTLRQTFIKSNDSDEFILHRTGACYVKEHFINYYKNKGMDENEANTLGTAKWNDYKYEVNGVEIYINWYRWTTMTPFVKGIDIIASGKYTTVKDGELVKDKTDKNATYRDLNNCFDLVTYSSAYGQNEITEIGGKDYDNCYGLDNVPDNITGGFTLNVHQVSANRILQMIYDNYGNSSIRPGRLDYASASQFTHDKYGKAFNPFYYAEEQKNANGNWMGSSVADSKHVTIKTWDWIEK